jgi:arylsulfatase A-like enzyme
LQVVGPYPAASVFVLAVVASIDTAISPGPRDGVFLVSLFCLVLAIGALHGLLWQGVQSLIARLPRLVALWSWPIAVVAASVWLARRLGAFSRLGGRYNLLALAVFGVCGAGALLLGFVLAGMQPRTGAVPARFASLPPRRRRAMALVLLLAGVALGCADRVLYVDTYALAHSALRVCAWWSAMFALVLCDAELALPRLTPARAVAIAAALPFPLARLDEHQPLALQAFAVRAWPSLVLSSARALLDFDRDGYASLLGGGDCAPFDPRIHPGAREIPDNGVDDNCMFGDAKRKLDLAERLPAAIGSSPLDVVLITIDTTRPDHLGAYNIAHRRAGRLTTPNIDRWALDATLFRHAYSAGGWTSIALPSLMRGMYARRLRWTRYYETNYFHLVRGPHDPRLLPGESVAQIFPFAYRDAHSPLALRLQRRGMYTAAVVDDGASDMLQRGIGFELGFDVLVETDDMPPDRRNDSGTTESALRVLQNLPPQRRFFLWVHYFGPHLPDEQHAGTPLFGNSPDDRYDHEISYLDRQLQPLLAALAARTPKPAVLLMADHGETIYPVGRNHGMNLDEEVIRVPLLAQVPGWPAGEVERLVSLVDVVPTVLALTRTPAPRGLDGIDLNPLLRQPSDAWRILLSDTWRYEPSGKPSLDYVAAYDRERKLVLDRVGNHLLAFDAYGQPSRQLGGEELAMDPLARAIYGYLDEAGGELQLGD